MSYICSSFKQFTFHYQQTIGELNVKASFYKLDHSSQESLTSFTHFSFCHNCSSFQNILNVMLIWYQKN